MKYMSILCNDLQQFLLSYFFSRSHQSKEKKKLLFHFQRLLLFVVSRSLRISLAVYFAFFSPSSFNSHSGEMKMFIYNSTGVSSMKSLHFFYRFVLLLHHHHTFIFLYSLLLLFLSYFFFIHLVIFNAFEMLYEFNLIMFRFSSHHSLTTSC